MSGEGGEGCECVCVGVGRVCECECVGRGVIVVGGRSALR